MIKRYIVQKRIEKLNKITELNINLRVTDKYDSGNWKIIDANYSNSGYFIFGKKGITSICTVKGTKLRQLAEAYKEVFNEEN